MDVLKNIGLLKDGQKYVCQKFMYTAPIHRNDLELVPGMQPESGL